MRVNNILETIGNTPHVRLNRLFADVPGSEVWLKLERANPGGEHQGPHRHRDDRRRRAARRAQAGRRDHRADVGQHGHRPRDGRGGEGVSAASSSCRSRCRSSGGASWPPTARSSCSRRRRSASRARSRRPRSSSRRRRARGCRSSSRTRRTSTSTGAPRRRRSCGLPRGHRLSHHRRRHRRPHHRRQRSAQEDDAEPQDVRRRAGEVVGHRRRHALAAQAPGHRHRLHPGQRHTAPCSTASIR